VLINSTTTVRAIAVKPGMTDSYVESVTYTLGAPGVTLAGRITYRDSPLSATTAVQPDFWFRDELIVLGLPGVLTSYDNVSGEYGFTNLPQHEVGISIYVHVTGSVASLPGNYYGWQDVDLSLLSPEQASHHDIPVSQIIHLTSPFDNNQRPTIGSYETYASPVLFQWDPIEGADHYSYVITEYSDSPTYAFVRTAAWGTIPGTSAQVALDPSAAECHYELVVHAYNAAGTMIGRIMTTYTSGVGWDYRFRVAP
jgi:hypothetical protein